MQLGKRQIYLGSLGIICALVSIFIFLRKDPIIFRPIDKTIDAPSSFSNQHILEKQKIIEKSIDQNNVFGFIRSINKKDGSISVELDEAEFIENKASSSTEDMQPGAADLASLEDGMCGTNINEVHIGQCASSGFYIRNNSTTTRSLLLNSTSKIIVLAKSSTLGIQPQDMTLSSFQKAFLNPPNPYNDPYYALTEGPYQVKLKNNIIIELKSFYIP